MDYSSIHDDHHGHGTSPWATSPQQSRQSFGQDRAPSPTPPLPQPAEETPIQQLTSSSEQLPPNSIESISATNGDSQDKTSGQVQQVQHVADPTQTHQPRGSSLPEPQQRAPGNRQQVKPVAPPKLIAKINGLERSGRKDPILRFDIYTNLQGYRTTQFRDVRRTHHEFERLADHLISAWPEAIVPAVPQSSTPAGVGTDEDDNRVKASMQRWMNYVCGNEVLMRDDEMVRFVEGDPGYSPVIKKSQPATGVRRKMLKQFAPPPDDTPELQDARPAVKLFYLGSMDCAQKVEKVVKARRGLGLAEAEFGQRLQSLTEQEIHPGLKAGLRKLGRTIQTFGDLHAAQGTAEATTLADPLNYHSSDAFIVKETLTNRHILIRELVQAQQATRSKLSATDRLKASSNVNPQKVDEAISALDEARSHEEHLARKTQKVTSNLVHERRQWFARTAADLRASLREYVVRQIEAERRALATLEAVRPDIRAIDSSGGLSRLGREAHPAARRATLMSSQGPKGDAWSGVERRKGDGLNRSISGGFNVQTPELDDDDEDNGESGRKRALSGTGSLKSAEEDDDDRVDARNAASRLATSTF